MKDRRNTTRLVQAVKIAAFAAAVAAVGVMGLVLPLRPEVSRQENRTLTKFPAYSPESLWDGGFFSGVDTWYADTYPLREQMISAQKKLESHYGLRSTQLVGGAGMVADAIPDAVPERTEPQPTPAVTIEPAASEEPAVTAEPTATPGPTPTPEPMPTPAPTAAPDGTVHALGEFNGGIYITQNAAYGTYYFSQSGADSYISTMNQIYQNIGGKVDMYVMDVPLSSAVMLDRSVIEDMGCSVESDAIDYIAGGLDPGIGNIRACDELLRHNGEYIYFRTDHHWTQLGAYYAYQAFCQLKGWTPHDLDQFRTREFGAGSYLGSYYRSANQSPELAEAPDTVQAWYPMCVNADDPSARDMHMVQQDGSEYDWRIINDMYDYPSSEWYCIFSAADQPFCSFHNPDIHDGSAVLVVKDSYGNAFIPWLVDHYEYTYWVDFRYTNETVSHMAETCGVQDVIFESATFNATGGLVNDRLLAIGS